MASGQYDRNYTLTYNAAAAGQTLTVTWKMTVGNGNVALKPRDAPLVLFGGAFDWTAWRRLPGFAIDAFILSVLLVLKPAAKE
jgi:hypothetical protein